MLSLQVHFPAFAWLPIIAYRRHLKPAAIRLERTLELGLRLPIVSPGKTDALQDSGNPRTGSLDRRA
jgi:hypothetical protein